MRDQHAPFLVELRIVQRALDAIWRDARIQADAAVSGALSRDEVRMPALGRQNLRLELMRKRAYFLNADDVGFRLIQEAAEPSGRTGAQAVDVPANDPHEGHYPPSASSAFSARFVAKCR